MHIVRRIVTARLWGYLLFWTWNPIFLAFMGLGFAPLILTSLLMAVVGGLVPPLFLIVGITLVLVPLGAIVLAVTVLRGEPGRLFALAYGIEWPLMFMLAVRFFILRDATPGVSLVITVATLGMATLLWQLVDKRIDERGTPLTIVRVAGLTVLLIIYLYASVWLGFYAVPLAAGIVRFAGEIGSEVIRVLVTFNWRELFTVAAFTLTFALTGGALAILSATLFMLTPIVVPILAIRSWWRAFVACRTRIGLKWAAGLAAGIAVVGAVTLFATNQQPQGAAFALLKNPPTTSAEAQKIAQQEETVRAGLVNSYLAPYRYISAVGEVNHVVDLYHELLGMSREQAVGVEAAYELVMRPLLYEPANPPGPVASNQPTARSIGTGGGAFSSEPAEAAKLYKAYFDERIVDGEHETVANSVRATWQATQAEAALQDVEDRKVHLDKQEINVKEHGDWAEVELHEVYRNDTLQRQEVVYYFSLPESAVITGVWLGNSEDKSARFEYRVAPRGAAQATYQQQLRRNLDPALVEQIGPRQYRLRVFPIEPKQWTGRATTGFSIPATQEAPPLHMWLAYSVMAKDNLWPLPLMSNKRSVYWDNETTHLVNGTALMGKADQPWLPETIRASTSIKPVAHQLQFASGETVNVEPFAASSLPTLPSNLRLAVVLDRSRSLRPLAAEVKATLARLAKIGNADVYLTSSIYRGEPPSRIKLNELDADRIEYIGGQNAGELLAQYDSLREGATYDAIVVITDGSGYELGESPVKPPVPNAPVWMVHLGSRIPLGYDDATLEAVQASGGSVTGSIDEALSRMAYSLNRDKGAGADWVDGYTWEVTRTGNSAAAATGDTAFAALAARRVVLDQMYRERGNLKQLSTLDQLHAIALKQGIVTPYSSMIVLVNSQQQQMLSTLEGQGDRYDREVEGVGDTQPPSALQVTGVPEPHEWLLIGLALVMLAAYAFRERLAPVWARVR